MELGEHYQMYNNAGLKVSLWVLTILEFLPVNFDFSQKFRLLFNAFHCFCMIVKKHFIYHEYGYLEN